MPDPFLTVRVHELSVAPTLTGVCAGYEQGEWRASRLAAHLIGWLPDFALNHSEREGLGAPNAVELIARAAETVYTSDKYQRRGEPGELILHAVLCQVFGTLPAISKIFFKDSANDTVKGFDAVHVVSNGDDLELWLGEVKFYADISRAIADVVEELGDHMERKFLRSEFAAITRKIDPTWPHADRLAKLLDDNTSLDDIFTRACIPVLLTYESDTIRAHDRVSQAFEAAFQSEALGHYWTFASKALPKEIAIHLILLPLHEKAVLMAEFDRRLKAAQALR